MATVGEMLLVVMLLGLLLALGLVSPAFLIACLMLVWHDFFEPVCRVIRAFDVIAFFAALIALATVLVEVLATAGLAIAVFATVVFERFVFGGVCASVGLAGKTFVGLLTLKSSRCLRFLALVRLAVTSLGTALRVTRVCSAARDSR
jgi:hypothetical protein